MSDEHDPLGILGRTLEDKYRVEVLAGMGGFSAVYRAQHLVWNEPVAIKFFTMLEDAEPELREQLLHDFIQEGKLMSQLSSKSAAIVQARDMGKLQLTDGGDWIPYMVLEWLDGTPLNEVVTNERAMGLAPRSLAEVMTLLEPAAIALDTAHRGNVAHRDLKPANLVITGDPRDPASGMKVLDFGIAKVMEAQAEIAEQMQMTGQHITAFTPNYGAPEQFSRNFGATGPWTDVFAMALIVLELLRGERVLDGESFFELGVASSNEEERPTPRALGLEVSDGVEAVFARALAVDPKRRYADMGEFWRALYKCAFPESDTWTARTDKPSLRNLQDYLHGNTRPSASQVIITSQDPPALGSPDTVAAITVTGKPRRARTPILWAAAAVAVASLVVLGVAINNRTSATSAPAAIPTEPAPDDSAKAPAAASPDQPDPVAPATSNPAPTESGSESDTAPSGSASAQAPGPKPRAATMGHPRPGPKPSETEPKTPEPTPAPGADAWDPSSFGGRR